MVVLFDTGVAAGSAFRRNSRRAPFFARRARCEQQAVERMRAAIEGSVAGQQMSGGMTDVRCLFIMRRVRSVPLYTGMLHVFTLEINL